MDNQHKLISGYRELTQEEIDLMNEGKALAETVSEYLEKVRAAAVTVGVDHRRLAIGRTELQQGFMAVIRSIAQPTTF